jgi:hypothetical protein
MPGDADKPTVPDAPPGDITSDSDDRIRDFLARHGGAGARPQRREVDSAGVRGWYEIYAADGYAFRCDWSRMGSREELQFCEKPPDAARATSAQ